MTNHTLLGPWVRRFLLEHLAEERNLAQNTQRSYRDALCLLLPFVSRRCRKLVDQLTVTDLSADVIRTFLADLERTRHCTVATRNQRLATIHALARFIGERSPENVQWCGEVRAVPFKRAEKLPIPYLEKQELDPLLSAPSLGTKLGQRDQALLLFLYNSGARASEAVRVNIEDLDFSPDGTGSVKLNGKGRKVRFCPLWAKTVSELLPLTRGRPTDAPVFVNRYGARLTRFGVYTVVKRHFRVAVKIAPSIGRKRVSPHTLSYVLSFNYVLSFVLFFGLLIYLSSCSEQFL